MRRAPAAYAAGAAGETAMRRVWAMMAVLAGLAGAAGAEPHAYTIVDAARVPAPLGGIVGDAARGAAAFATHCAACHADPAFGTASPATLRLAIIDLSVARPAVTDHAFYDPDAEGRTRLRAATVEDIVAYLAADR